jgi:hypothetical protein
MKATHRILIALAGVGLGLVSLGLPSDASAHCDTLDGPVVADARTALRTGSVTPALKWIPKAEEGALRDAFARTAAARKQGAAAEALADRWFFETLVRVHRSGEGAPFDGLKPAGSNLPHAVVAADRALAGKLSVDELAKHVAAAVDKGIRARHAAVLERKKHVGRSVEDGRKYVAAYVEYVHYVEAIAELANGGASHGAEPSAAKAHPH